jgi:RHS repeat-associated protein
LSTHLQNVLVTVSDKKTAVDDGTYTPTTAGYTKVNSTPDGIIDYYKPDIITANDYYPFGMMMPGRKYSTANKYRYGFNGKEKDNEVSGDGNQYDYGFRIYNPRLGRFLSVDPLSPKYPFYTPYQFASNNPIMNVDIDGLEGDPVITKQMEEAAKGAVLAQTNDAQLKHAVAADMLIIVRLSEGGAYRAFPINDGMASNGVAYIDMQNSVVERSWVFNFAPPVLLQKDNSPPADLISSQPASTSGILPRKNMGRLDLETGNPCKERRGSKVVDVDPEYGTSTSTGSSISSLPTMDFETDKPEFEDKGSATSSLAGYLRSLPSGTLSVTINISVKAKEDGIIKSGIFSSYTAKDLMADRIKMVRSIIPKGLSFPINTNPQYTPGVKQTMSATAYIPTTTASTVVKGWKVTRQPIKQQFNVFTGKPCSPATNAGASSTSHQTSPPPAVGTTSWNR